MLDKIKKASNILATLLILVAIAALSVEAVKLNSGEDYFFDHLAAAVDELSMKTPPIFSPRETEDDSGNAAAIENERNKNGQSKSTSNSNVEVSKNNTVQKNTTNVEADQQPEPQQEQHNQKAGNLDYPPEKVVFHKDLAAENIRLLNAERKKRGLPELQVHNVLMEIAHIKVNDMMTYNYYGHGSPRIGHTTTLIGERVGDSRVRSENLNLIRVPTFWYKELGNSFSDELAGMAKDSHDSLMRSDGHRENMLNPELVYVGVAAAGNVIVEDGEEYYVFKVAQVFMSEPW